MTVAARWIERRTERIVNESRKLARDLAQELLRERRAATQIRQKKRRARMLRRLDLGAAVQSAGLGEWSTPELVGALLDAEERLGRSPTMRMAARQRGEQHLAVARGPPATPSLPAEDEPLAVDVSMTVLENGHVEAERP
jgi:hypothetical protein